MHPVILILVVIAIVLLTLFFVGTIHAGVITGAASWSVLALPKLKGKL